MCAVSATSSDGHLGLSTELTRFGKYPKVALTVAMHKLAILANTLIAENRRWEPLRS
jgi:hypothetical protein